MTILLLLLKIVTLLAINDDRPTAEAYLSLKQQQMQALELPVHYIQQDITLYSDEIEKLTRLAIQETN
ncbi:MAG: hypothetical protein ACI8UG_000160 [Gammaproteobacteria bacterium]